MADIEYMQVIDADNEEKSHRIKKLEKALRKIATQEPEAHAWCVGVARAALEGKE